MNALFLAGGLGTRLRPLTEDLPKPMVPVMGKPLLERNFEKLKIHGGQRVVLSTCYKAERFRSYFGDGKGFGLRIHYVSEDTPLGTGGAIKNAERYFHEPFLIFNADIICDIDFSDMLRFHEEKQADVTIAATYVEDPTAYGVIEYDKSGYAVTFKEKPKPSEVNSHYINAGVYIFNPEILRQIPAGRVVSVEKEVFPTLLQKGYKVAVYRDSHYWLDLGTPEKYVQIHRDIFGGKYQIGMENFYSGAAKNRENLKIHKTARIRKPVCLGKNVHIEAGAVVGPNVMLGDNCIIGKNCHVANSILWDNVTVEQKVRILDSIIMADCFVGNDAKYENLIYTEEAQRLLVVS